MEKKTSTSAAQLSSESVQFLIKIIFAQSPQPFQAALQNAVTNVSRVLMRQMQLASTKFVHQNICQMSTNLEGLCERLRFKSEDVDPDRLVWLSVETLARYLIRPGQWVTLSRYKGRPGPDSKSSTSKEDFKCQVVPVTHDDKNAIGMNNVTEYNLRKALSIPAYMPIPPLQIKPLLTDPLLKTTSQSLSFSPMQGKSVKLTRLSSSREVSEEECAVLIEDAFASHCKYLCVGDLISLTVSPDFQLELVVSEINDKRIDDGCKELFKVHRSTSTVSLSSSHIYNQFHLQCDNASTKRSLAPCLAKQFQKLSGWTRQALTTNYNESVSTSRVQSFTSELWPNMLIYGPIGSGKFSTCQALASSLGLNLYFLNATNLIGDTSAYTEGKLKAVYEKVANSLCPALIYIKNLHFVGKDKDGNEDKRMITSFKEFIHDIATLSCDGNFSSSRGKSVMSSKATFVIGSTDSPEKLVHSISQDFLFKLEFPAAMKSTEEVGSTLNWLFHKSGVKLEKGVELNAWTKANCEGMQRSLGDLKALATTVKRNAFTRLNADGSNGVSSDVTIKITLQDLDQGLNEIDTILKKAASTVEVPKVSWDDIGGLEEIKRELINSVKLPLEFPHLFGETVRRSGILLYGPPGTGKTLIAKAVATEFKLSFLSVKGPELLNMYVGQSEQNVRDVFSKARNAAPCIIFFDELDALAPNRGRAGDSGGVMDRVVSQILAELDGTHTSPGVFVIGATNRPDLIDPALLRPGRFDKLLHVGINQDNESKTSVLKALTRKFNLDQDVDLKQISNLLPEGMSGADLYSLCSDAYMTAIERNIDMVSNGEPNDLEMGVLVKKCDFEASVSRVAPSLSSSEQEKYDALKFMKR